MVIDNASLAEKVSNRQVHEALGLWHKSPARGSPLEHLVVVQRSLSDTGGNLRLATNQVLHSALTAMGAQHADLSRLLRMRFLDRRTVHALANERNVADSTIYIQQNRAIALLTSIVHEMEHAAVRAIHYSLADRLPPSGNTSLLGIADHMYHLLRRMKAVDGPELLVLEGIGGIGKTALASAVVRQAMQLAIYQGVCWVSMQQHHLHLDGNLRHMPRPGLGAQHLIDQISDQALPGKPERHDRGRPLDALREHLSQTPHLIVVDNLELADHPDQIFALARQLAGVSRFLFISRHCYFGEADAYHYRLGELASSDALALIREESERRNLPDLVSAPDADLHPIFDIVGGNPLALRLTVGQLHIRPLPDVLADLATGQGAPTQALYTYIYRRVWDELDEVCQRVLLTLPLVVEAGISEDHLSRISGLSTAEVCRALAILVTRNLVDSRGDLVQRRYAIHRLTRSFLREPVVCWQH